LSRPVHRADHPVLRAGTAVSRADAAQGGADRDDDRSVDHLHRRAQLCVAPVPAGTARARPGLGRSRQDLRTRPRDVRTALRTSIAVAPGERVADRAVRSGWNSATSQLKARTEPTDAVATADPPDEVGPERRSCHPQFLQFAGRAAFSGRITTIRCFQDNLLVKQTLSEPGEGKVLVVDGGASVHTALVGDIIAGRGVDNGWAGVIVNGAVR